MPLSYLLILIGYYREGSPTDEASYEPPKVCGSNGELAVI